MDNLIGGFMEVVVLHVIVQTYHAAPFGNIMLIWLCCYTPCGLNLKVVRNLDMSCLLAPEGTRKSGKLSEYGWQAQAYLLTYSILKGQAAFNSYRWVGLQELEE